MYSLANTLSVNLFDTDILGGSLSDAGEKLFSLLLGRVQTLFERLLFSV